MKIELLFCKHANGFDSDELFVGKFPTKKAAYQYVKASRKFYCSGSFMLCITKKNDYYFEPVRPQDILNV